MVMNSGDFSWFNGLYIIKAYVREYPQKIWPCMVQYLHFNIMKFPLNGDLMVM